LRQAQVEFPNRKGKNVQHGETGNIEERAGKEKTEGP
jgi:hypothetical protein